MTLELVSIVAAVLAILSPICSAAYVVGRVRAELAGLRRDVDRAHERIDGVQDKLFEVIT